MLGFIDNIAASEEEHRLARQWADYACRRFGDEAPGKLKEGLHGSGKVKSKRALRIAIRRVQARIRTTIAIATR